jgi:hypothetical protein
VSQDDDQNTRQLAQSILQDLGLGEGEEARLVHDLRQHFGELLDLTPMELQRIGFDAAVVMGLSGDWNMTLDLCKQLSSKAHDDRMELKLWQLRALVELSRFHEALALGTSTRWPSNLLVHVNYLTGEACENLRMYEEARLRFDAVLKFNRDYRDIAQRVSKY